MYVLVLLLIGVFAGGQAAQSIISPLILVLALVLLVETQLIKGGLRRLLNERLPGEPMKGLTLYAILRSLQIRKLRIRPPGSGREPRSSPPGAGSSGRTRCVRLRAA